MTQGHLMKQPFQSKVLPRWGGHRTWGVRITARSSTQRWWLHSETSNTLTPKLCVHVAFINMGKYANNRRGEKGIRWVHEVEAAHSGPLLGEGNLPPIYCSSVSAKQADWFIFIHAEKAAATHLLHEIAPFFYAISSSSNKPQQIWFLF